jgi:RNA polymerase sigma factor (sigma-70 family)
VPGTESADLEELYRKHRARLVRLVERELHDRDEAEDAVQTAFLDAQRALQRGTIPHNPRAWLAAIALNAARRVRRRHVDAAALEEYAVQEASRLPELKEALAGLPKNEQVAVLYRDVLGLSYAEMAERMDRTVPAVTMLLHRARGRLRSLLGLVLVGGGLSRWLRGHGWDATAANAAGVVAVAGGLATAGVVTSVHVAHRAAPTAVTAAVAIPPANGLAGASLATVRRRSSPAKPSASPSARPHPAPSPAATVSAAPAGHDASRSPTVPVVRATAPEAPQSSPRPTLGVPTLTTPSTPATPPLGATVPVPTPVTTTTVAVPPLPATTATVTTPVATATVTVP